MVTVEGSVRIQRPVDEVFAFVTDPTNDPAWQFDVVEAGPRSDGPIAVGSRIRRLVKFMGRRETENEVTRFEPGRLEKIEVRSGAPFGLRPRVTYRFDSVDGATKFTRHLEMEARGAGRIMEPMMGLMARRYNARFLRTLKGVLER